ncbi:MAG: DUF5103 domain-containing protein [Prevotella sp.]|nr:DUF5103 domain-containing protein [Prevotella sp.]
MKYGFMTFILFLYAIVMTAQRNEIYDDRIQSLQVVANGDWLSPPVMELHDGRVSIDFDDMTHEYTRYTYKLEHCNWNWTKNDEIFDSDYCEGFTEGNTIDDVQESLLTNTLYTHYSLKLPNNECKMKISGNYRVTVYDENAGNIPVFSACFMVTEPKAKLMTLGMSITGNTDAGFNTHFQQVAMTLNYGKLYTVTDPTRQLKTVVTQNGRWDNARWNAKPQFVRHDGLAWDHCRDYIFDGGNEYHKFEILSTDVAAMGIDKIRWDGTEYHAYPFVSKIRLNYLYDEDAKGAFYIRNSDNIGNDYQSDYMTVHFELETPRPADGEVYVNGQWTHDSFLPKYKMEYNDNAKRYECEIPLKLGYYSYQYVLVKNGVAGIMPTEGNFFQTQNNYQALVYYRETGGRTDRLVAYTQVAARF